MILHVYEIRAESCCVKAHPKPIISRLQADHKPITSRLYRKVIVSGKGRRSILRKWDGCRNIKILERFEVSSVGLNFIPKCIAAMNHLLASLTPGVFVFNQTHASRVIVMGLRLSGLFNFKLLLTQYVLFPRIEIFNGNANLI
jgi:hypothetical protein